MVNNLIIQLNSDCNLNCSYCYAKNKFITNKKNIKKSIQKIIKKYKIINVTITGGEPLLEYKFLIEILNNLKNKNMEKFVLTNGTLLNDSMLKELKDLNTKLRIGIDSFFVNEKRPNKKLVELIKKNKIRYASKVMTKKNLKYLYSDFLNLANIGFKDIDIIPQMYIYWSNKEIDFISKEIKKVIIHCLKNEININLLGLKDKNRYYRCNKIRVLPDGDISFCNSLNSVKKAFFLKNKRLNQFELFKKKTIKFALENYSRKRWFKEKYLNNFCMIDAFYYSYINNKNSKWIISVVDLFSTLNNIIEREVKLYPKMEIYIDD